MFNKEYVVHMDSLPITEQQVDELLKKHSISSPNDADYQKVLDETEDIIAGEEFLVRQGVLRLIYSRAQRRAQEAEEAVVAA